MTPMLATPPPKTLFIPQEQEPEPNMQDDNNRVTLAHLKEENHLYAQEHPDLSSDQPPFDFLETHHSKDLIKNHDSELIICNINKSESKDWYSLTTQTWLKWIKCYNASHVPYTPKEQNANPGQRGYKKTPPQPDPAHEKKHRPATDHNYQLHHQSYKNSMGSSRNARQDPQKPETERILHAHRFHMAT
jgi:hypothetical protein